METRGKLPRGTASSRRCSEPRKPSALQMFPEGYRNTLIRDTVKRMNVILRSAGSDIESWKFLHELKRLLDRQFNESPRRA